MQEIKHLVENQSEEYKARPMDVILIAWKLNEVIFASEWYAHLAFHIKRTSW